MSVVNPYKHMYYLTFKSLPEWKRQVMVAESIEKAIERNYFEGQTPPEKPDLKVVLPFQTPPTVN